MNPQSVYESGIQLLQANKTEEAASAFRQVIIASPHFARAYNLLGVCYSRMGKTELAQKAFLEAVNSDPKLSEPHSNLGSTYLALGKPELAADQFQQAALLNPNDPSQLLSLGRTRLIMKQAQAAVVALSDAQKLSPEDMRISAALGEAYFMAGQAEKAQTVLASICSAPKGVSDFQIAAGVILLRYQHPADAEACLLHATTVDPSGDDNLLVWASRLLDKGDYQTVLGILGPFKQTMENVPAYHDLIGFAYIKLGQLNSAVQAFQRALQLDPGNENYFLDFGQALNESNAQGAAIELFRSGLSAHPNSARLYVGLALAYTNATRLREARAAAEKAISLQPTLETAYATLAIVCESEKDWPSLLSNALRLQSLNPRNYRGWYYEALARMELQHGGEQAVHPQQIFAPLRRAIELEPSFPLAHFQLGKQLLRQKDYRGSIIELKRTIEMNPYYVEAHFLLATAYRKVGDVQHSQEHLDIHRKLITEVGSRQGPELNLQIANPH